MSSLVVGITASAQAPTLAPVGTSWPLESEGMRLRVEVVATDIAVPWGIAFLPDGRLLVTDRQVGRMVLVNLKTGTTQDVNDVPPVHGKVDGGMLDVVLHPEYATNGWIYFAYAVDGDGGSSNAVDRARLRDGRLVDRQRLFTARPFVDNNDHFGSRLVLSGGYLFISLGERNIRTQAQDLRNHHGKIIRIHDDGRVPADNPFRGTAGAMPEIWSYGHRNPQGLAMNPATGELWESEHGPRGGDEINIIQPGRNYGWPVIGYGREYAGPLINDGLVARDSMEQPIHYWVPSIAPSGMEFYTGNAFPRWKGSLFIGALAKTHLNRVVFRDGKVVLEERLLGDKNWRVRVVKQGPDGLLYIGVDGGMVLRIRPDR